MNHPAWGLYNSCCRTSRISTWLHNLNEKQLCCHNLNPAQVTCRRVRAPRSLRGRVGGWVGGGAVAGRNTPHPGQDGFRTCSGPQTWRPVTSVNIWMMTWGTSCEVRVCLTHHVNIERAYCPVERQPPEMEPGTNILYDGAHKSRWCLQMMRPPAVGLAGESEPGLKESC